MYILSIRDQRHKSAEYNYHNFGESFSPKTILEKRIETRKLSLSIGTTILLGRPVMLCNTILHSPERTRKIHVLLISVESGYKYHYPAEDQKSDYPNK